MTRVANMLAVTAILAMEIVFVSLATSASAQDSSSPQIRRQQRLILQQQRLIEQNQRRLEAQEQRLGRATAAAPQTVDRGILGNIGNCPVGWTYGLFTGCLPAVHGVN